VGVVISELSGGGVGRIEISDSYIMNFGKNGLRVEGDAANPAVRVSICNNQIGDNCHFADNTQPVIYVGANSDFITISDNMIYRANEANTPTYGIEIATASDNIVVTDNLIHGTNDANETVRNVQRGSALTRKISGNSGQVFEGQVVTLGPWIKLDLSASFGGRLAVADATAAIDLVVPRRGRVIGIAARASGNVGSIPAAAVTFQVWKNGANAGLVASNAGPSVAECFGENLAGVEFAAADQLGINVVTTAAYAPDDTLDWAVYVSIYYD
jgi:hypothetical protein